MDRLKNAWTKFRAWPDWLQVATWVGVGIFILAAIVPGTEEQKPTTAVAPADPGPTTTAPPATTTTTIDVDFIRTEAARYCTEAAMAGVEGSPGVENELTDETIDLLVEVAVSAIREDVVGMPGGHIAIGACDRAARTYFEQVRSTTTTVPPGPATTIPPGTYAVGEDIEPGRYRTEGGEPCYWATLRNVSGTGDDIIANNLSRGGADIVEIGEDVPYFETSGCATWTKG